MAKELHLNGEAVINFSSFQDMAELRNAVLEAVKRVDVGAVNLGGVVKNVKANKGEINALDINNIEADGVTIEVIKNLFAELMADTRIEAAIIKCLSRSTYNGVKITIDTFNDEKAIRDYLPIALACAEVHLSPFFGSLGSMLNQLKPRTIVNQK